MIAQEVRAGGHVKDEVSALVLPPQVAQALDIPLIGSGGFASGVGLGATRARGAAGVDCAAAFWRRRNPSRMSFAGGAYLTRARLSAAHTDAFSIN